MNIKLIVLLLLGNLCAFAHPITIPHQTLKTYSHEQNSLMGIATPSLGAVESEVWQSSIGVDNETPFHMHSREELIILVAGELKATVGDESSTCAAPCTIVLPANIKHKLENTGTIPTMHYAIMPSKSKIYDDEQKEMHLPWRN